MPKRSILRLFTNWFWPILKCDNAPFLWFGTVSVKSGNLANPGFPWTIPGFPLLSPVCRQFPDLPANMINSSVHMYVWVGVCERERETERETPNLRERQCVWEWERPNLTQPNLPLAYWALAICHWACRPVTAWVEWGCAFDLPILVWHNLKFLT